MSWTRSRVAAAWATAVPAISRLRARSRVVCPAAATRTSRPPAWRPPPFSRQWTIAKRSFKGIRSTPRASSWSRRISPICFSVRRVPLRAWRRPVVTRMGAARPIWIRRVVTRTLKRQGKLLIQFGLKLLSSLQVLLYSALSFLFFSFFFQHSKKGVSYPLLWIFYSLL